MPIFVLAIFATSSQESISLVFSHYLDIFSECSANALSSDTKRLREFVGVRSIFSNGDNKALAANPETQPTCNVTGLAVLIR